MPTATEQALFACSSDIYNCGSFSSQDEAQTVYEYCLDRGAGDIHRLDENNDGTACESYDYPGGFRVIR